MSENFDILNHPEPDHIGNGILEEQIEAKLASLTRNHRDYQTRLLRIERNRLEIHARKRMTRRYQSSYYTPDQLAHQLTIELAAQSPYTAPDLARGLSQDLLRDFLSKVDQFLLIPELALSDRHLLTHIYCPTWRLLALYLYPRRFDQPGHATGTRENQQPRLDVVTTAGRLGLLGSVIAAVSQFRVREAGPGIAPAASAPGSPILHKFIVPCEYLAPEENEELQAIHDLYSEEDDLQLNGDSGDAL